ncbi:hypothetical protein GOB82_11660 [Acetobacter farinalis]|nr:hypothetical protein [Acetobacter farinalis]
MSLRFSLSRRKAARKQNSGNAYFVPLDQGNPVFSFRGMVAEMAPVPGRLENTIRLTCLTILFLLIGETFRLPEVAIFVWIGFLLSGNDAATSSRMALTGGGMIIIGTGASILCMMVTMDEPAIRLPLMVFLTLCAGYLSAVMTAGMLANVFFFWTVYLLTMVDLAASAGNTIDAWVGNTTESVIPDSKYFPPEESFLHECLWFALLYAVALTVIIVTNHLWGRDPGKVLKNAESERVLLVADAMETGCELGSPAMDMVFRSSLQGVSGFRKLYDLALSFKLQAHNPAVSLTLIRYISRISLMATLWSTTVSERKITQSTAVSTAPDLLKTSAGILRQSAKMIQDGNDEAEASAVGHGVNGVLKRLAKAFDTNAALHPLAREIARSVAIILALSSRVNEDRGYLPPESDTKPASLFKPGADVQRAGRHAAGRLCLSVTICYLIERLTDWPGIGVCVLTCFVVPMGTIGDTTHKMFLRLFGALAGGLAGIFCILVFMPVITGITGLILMMTPVLFVSAWIKSGSDRIAYAGVQTALAFCLSTLQGYGPTLDMETARNRVIGVLLGNVVVALVSTTLWPVSVATIARKNLANAINILAKMTVFKRANPDAPFDPVQEGEREAFGQSIAAVRSSFSGDALEGASVSKRLFASDFNHRLLTEIQLLAVKISVIVDMSHLSSAIVDAKLTELAGWLRKFAQWIVTGEGYDELKLSVPTPPDLPDDPERTIWFSFIDDEIRKILRTLDAAQHNNTGLSHG